MVDIRIYGPLWEHLEPNLELDLQRRDATVADLLARLGLDPTEVGIVTVDRRQSTLDARIPAQSRVCIFPPMFGG